jgi:hypothetical protein
MLFQPSRDEVRRFFIEAWEKQQRQALLTPLEALAVEWVREHPEYHSELSAAGLERDYRVTEGQTNPFLHLAMHLSISEQTSIDQPPGIHRAIETLAQRLDSLHQAHHQAMECLGQMLWESQRRNAPPEAEKYLECLKQAASSR